MRSLQEISGALHLSIFDQSDKNGFFSDLLVYGWREIMTGSVATMRGSPFPLPSRIPF